MMEEVKRMIEKNKPLMLNEENWALYISPEDQHEMYDDMDVIMQTEEGELPWNAMDVITDPTVDEPKILPVRPDLMPSEHEFQDDPPVSLVKQMIEPEIVDRQMLGRKDQLMLRAEVEYEVTQVAYEIPLRKAEDAFSHHEVKQVVSRAVKGEDEWEAEVVESREVWVLHRDIGGGWEVKSVPIMFQGDETAVEHMDIEQRMAEDAIELIGGDITKELTKTVERRVDDPSDQPMAPTMEEEPEMGDMSFETETEEIQVATKRFDLGRMRLS